MVDVSCSLVYQTMHDRNMEKLASVVIKTFYSKGTTMGFFFVKTMMARRSFNYQVKIGVFCSTILLGVKSKLHENSRHIYWLV